MIKAVVFDLDGTLLNRDASVQTFTENQYDRLKEWLGHIPKQDFIPRFIDLDCRGYVWKDKVYQQLVDEFNITGMTWEMLLQDYITEFQHSCIPFPHLKSMLESLKDHSIRLGMITNGYGQFQMDNIKALGIEDYFDTIIISEWENLRKPDPEIFRKALRQMNVQPSESIYVGDHPENDVKGAKAIGMITAWKRDLFWEDIEADFTIEELSELPVIVEELNRTKVN